MVFVQRAGGRCGEIDRRWRRLVEGARDAAVQGSVAHVTGSDGALRLRSAASWKRLPRSNAESSRPDSARVARRPRAASGGRGASRRSRCRAASGALWASPTGEARPERLLQMAQAADLEASAGGCQAASPDPRIVHRESGHLWRAQRASSPYTPSVLRGE
jgi:hypothetical protein